MASQGSAEQEQHDKLAQRRKALGEHVRAERALDVGSVSAAAKVIGINRGTLDRLEDGQPAEDYTYYRVERALRWPRGSALRYLADGQVLPEPVADLEPTGGPPSVTAVQGLDDDAVAFFVARGADSPVERLQVVNELLRAAVAELQDELHRDGEAVRPGARDRDHSR